MTDTLGAIIVAAGSGTRMDGLDKLFTEIAGRPLLAHAVAPFQDSPLVSHIVLVLSPLNLKRGRDLAEHHAFTKVAAVVQGGPRRQDSIHLGLEALPPCDYVAVHDGARPLVSTALIERGVQAAREHGTAVPAIPIADTIKESRPDGSVVRTVDRTNLYTVQTPQFFRRDLLERAHREVTTDATDDAAMLEALGLPVRVFEGDPRNLKVTVAGDLEMVGILLYKALSWTR
jgi:2-C-methyl-D-erythritol 4-phosphate cytidylyltransferase